MTVQTSRSANFDYINMGAQGIAGRKPSPGMTALDAIALTFDITAVPEPSSTALLGLGGLALALRRKRS